jgi:hypothetical protein
MQAASVLAFVVLLLLSGACATSKSSNKLTSSNSQLGNNNLVTTHSKNSRYSSDKTDGASTLIIKGQNNIINIDLTDSDIKSFNSKTVTIIDGDNNNLSSITRKCVLVYQGRTDTLIIKGNQLKLDFTSDNMTALIDGEGGKETITTGQHQSSFNWAAWKNTKPTAETEEVYVENLNKYLKPADAFRHYTERAQHGDYQACYMLGRFFDNLLADTEVDMAKAIPYYEMAARHDHAEAAFRLGHIYEVGDFEFEKVAINRPKAEYYYGLAAKNGSEPAREKLAQWAK